MKKIKKYRDSIRKLNLYMNKLIVEVEALWMVVKLSKDFLKD
ncbi:MULTISPECIES: hypothetical protein [Clostridium]|nr:MULTISPECIES: hypothetical protein [Clostridium]